MIHDWRSYAVLFDFSVSQLKYFNNIISIYKTIFFYELNKKKKADRRKRPYTA